MITISLCMIVKNEERILARCLDSLAGLMDEIIIVDTGSTDRTKEIAARDKDKFYDLPCVDDYIVARNFALSKATMEYIYSADADEVLSEENRERFRVLKENLLPEIELVQMKYGNQLQFGTVYNFDEEYRPKLFKRKRDFIWEDPIHETVRMQPVIYDSDIVITHMPEQSHVKRDLANFQKQIAAGRKLSGRLQEMYARELFLNGDTEDFQAADSYFRCRSEDENSTPEGITDACCVVAKAARLRGDALTVFRYTPKVIAGEGCSEICCELGHFYEEQEDYEEAAIWYYNAVYETVPVLRLASGGKESLEGLVRCYEQLGLPEQAESYRDELTKAGDEQ